VLHDEALHGIAVIDHFAQMVVDFVERLFARDVVPVRDVVGRVLFARQQKLVLYVAHHIWHEVQHRLEVRRDSRDGGDWVHPGH